MKKKVKVRRKKVLFSRGSKKPLDKRERLRVKTRKSAMKRNFWPKVRKYLLILILLALAGAVGYIAVKSAIELRKASDSGLETTSDAEPGFILGIDDIPKYPGSRFMFETHMHEDAVEKFLSSGSSAYILPDAVSWEKVKEYYEKELQEYGWEHVLSVELGDKNHKFGEYWVKVKEVEGTSPDQESPEMEYTVGLRIYYRLEDVWYETISVEQARNGLADVVAKEDELDLILSMSSPEELPKDFVWKLKFPSVWNVKIKKSRFLDISMAEFTRPDEDGTLVIEPLEYFKDIPLQQVGARYIQEINNYRSEGEKFEIASTSNITVAKEDSVRFNLSSDDQRGFICLVPNSNNGVVYAIATFDGEGAFWEFVISNVEVRDFDEAEDTTF